MRPRFLVALVALILTLLGCKGEDVGTTRTQITLRIQMEDPALLASTTHVRVQLLRKDDAWVRTSNLTHPTSDVRWPLDIPIVPRSPGAVSKPFEVIVEALAGETRLAQARVITGYALGSLRVLEIWLYACRASDEDRLCAADDCHGETCATCGVGGECRPVATIDPTTLPAFVSGEVPASMAPSQPDARTNGSNAPDDGSNAPDDGSVAPDDGSVAPDDGGIAPAESGVMPQESGSMPQDGGVTVVPPRGGVTCSPACGANAECVVSGISASCVCLRGFMDMAGTCVDVNECATNNGDCGANGSCSNTAGSRTCDCRPGFERAAGAKDCTDKCAAAGCDPHATCTIQDSAAVCSCTPPYIGTDGKSCTFDATCALLSCGQNAACEVMGTTRACKCAPGFTGNGTSCTNVDECSVTPGICGLNAICLDTPGAYTCTCVDGFQNRGSGCENIDDCTSASCLNSGKCVDGIKSTTCNCTGTGFEGDRCQTNTSDCTATSCLNGGLCVDGLNAFTCNCSTVDYSGTSCQTRIDDCVPNPCVHGTCVDGNRAWSCNCGTSGYMGTRCETDKPDCPTFNPCLNGGSCVDGVNGYTCSCVSPFMGPTCEQRTCSDTFIFSAETLANARNCAVINGWLHIAGAGLSSIGATDLPFLTRVTGELSITTFLSQQPDPKLTTVTLSKLQSVGGRFQIAATTGLITATFPELTSVGSIDSVTGSLVHWNMPKLTTVNGNVAITLQANKCTFAAPLVATVTGAVTLEYMPKVPASAFAPLVRAARGVVSQKEIGCCFLGDTANCTGPPTSYLCGCL